jgi:hypothetical protein
MSREAHVRFWESVEVELPRATHFLILNEAHLRRLLRGYIAYYNTARPHQSLTTTVPSHEVWNSRHVAESSRFRRLAGSIIAIGGSPDRRRAPGPRRSFP